MTRPTLYDLAQFQANAAFTYTPGSYIRHGKTGNVYEVMFISSREADAELLVTFRPADHDDAVRINIIGRHSVDARDALITRPYNELAEVVYEANYTGPRFFEVAKKEVWERV